MKMFLPSRLAVALTGLTVLLSVTLNISGCGGSENTEEDALLQKLDGTWTATSVNVDGQFVNGAFADFSITFSGKTFVTANGNNPIWPPSGTFSVKPVSSTIGFSLMRTDDIEITIIELTDATLVLQFDYSSSAARTASVGGEYTFELQR